MGHWVAQVTGVAEVGGFPFVCLTCPPLSAQARPGQFLLARPWPHWDPYLRQVVFVTRRISPDTCWVYAPGSTVDTLSPFWRMTDQCPLWGPWGTGFPELPAHNRVLVMTQETYAPYLLGTIYELAEINDLVFLLLREDTLLPEAPSWLPPSVEYRPIVGGMDALLAACQDLLRWTDYLLACGPVTWPQQLVHLWEDTRSTLPPKRAFMLLVDGLTCGLGLCDTCVVMTRHGPTRVCRRGPVMDLAYWWGTRHRR